MKKYFRFRSAEIAEKAAEKRKNRKRKMLSFASVTALFLASVTFGGCTASDEQNFAWPLATASPEDTVTQLFAEKFAEETDRLSNGKMKIEVFPNSTLGGDRDLLESCADGDIPFIVQNTAPQVAFMNDLAVFDLPSVFDSLDDLREKIDEPAFDSLIHQVYEDGGYHLLGIADQGFRVMSTNRMVTSFGDFKGQKIRTMENPYHLKFWQSISASPTPMSFSEVYIGLQQHTIDAQENPYEVIVSNRLYEQQDYIINTNHLPHLITLIVNDSFYQDLTEDEQEILDEAAALATEYAREMSDERISEKVAQIEDSGTQIVDLDEETMNEIRSASGSLYEQIRQEIAPEIYDSYLN